MAIVWFLLRYASWKNTLILLAAQFIFQGLILFWLYPRIGGQGVPLDMRSGLSIAAVQEYLTGIGPAGRKIYAWNEGTLDVLYPLLYAPAYAFFLLRLITPIAGATSRWCLLSLLPFAIAIADLCENASIIGAIATFTQSVAWAGAVVFFNTIKGSLMVPAIVVLLIFICLRLIFSLKRRGT